MKNTPRFELDWSSFPGLSGMEIQVQFFKGSTYLHTHYSLNEKKDTYLHNRAALCQQSYHLIYYNSRSFSIISLLHTVFKNKLLTKVDARTNGQCHENHCIKNPSHL